MVVPKIVPPKTNKGKRALEKREPKVFENPKVAMLIKGGNTSQTVTEALKDVGILKKPHAITYKRKNIVRPFESEHSMEFFSDRSDSSLFLFGSHSKKRPHNLVIGRMFDHHVMDMIELGILDFKSIAEHVGSKVPAETKPCLLFAGEAFERDEEYKRLKNVFIDFFRGPVIDTVRLTGLEHILQFVVMNGRIYIRSYRVILKNSGCKIPRVELENIGPSFELVMRRKKLASDDLFKRACRVPKESKIKKTKNIAHDPFRNKTGRIHMERQDYSKLQTRKVKGFKPLNKGKLEDRKSVV